MARTTTFDPEHPAIPAAATPRGAERSRLEARQRQGKLLVVAGWVSAVIGVVLYCVASFAADASASFAEIVLHDAAPAVRAALVVVGCGTLLWIVGSVMHINAVLGAAELDAEHGRRGAQDGEP